MEILNETGYSTDDLNQIIRWCQIEAFKQAVQEARNRKAAKSTYGTTEPDEPIALPSRVSFGYYKNPRAETGKEATSSATAGLAYVSVNGSRRYRVTAGTIRFGLPPVEKLPTNPMVLLAQAVAGDETVPDEVLADVVVIIRRVLFDSYSPRQSYDGTVTPEAYQHLLIDGCPKLHYGFAHDKKAAAQMREAARSERVQSLKRRIGYAVANIERLEKSMAEERETLVKLSAQLAKLEVGEESREQFVA